jgi:hypothetical protein
MTTPNPAHQHVTAYTDASIDALIAATAGAGLPDVGGYPILKLLQKNNPETDQYSEDYVEGARAGLYWLAATETLYAKPVVQLLGLRPYWKEWKPNRGGPGDEHAQRPEEAKKFSNPTTGREQWKMPSGNEVEQTCDLVMLIDGVKCGLPFKSTGLTALRNAFIIPLKQKRVTLADGRQVAPARFHVKARLGVKGEHNNWGDWVNPFPEQFFLYREEGGPSKKEIVEGFKAAEGYLQLTADKLAALPNFAAVVNDPPAPSTEQPKPIITSGPQGRPASQARRAAQGEAPPPVEPRQARREQGPPAEPFDDDAYWEARAEEQASRRAPDDDGESIPF